LVAALIGSTSLATLWWRREDLSSAFEEHEVVPEKHATRVGNVSFLGLLQLPMTWFAFGFFFFPHWVMGALENFAPSLLRDLYGLSLAAATSGLTSLPGRRGSRTCRRRLSGEFQERTGERSFRLLFSRGGSYLRWCLRHMWRRVGPVSVSWPQWVSV
jgi:hypothetical protein